MATNPKHDYVLAEKEYRQAKTNEDKLKYLQKMLSLAPDHKAAENLRGEIKKRIAKFKLLLEQEKKKKKGYQKINIKKEGAATVVIVGTTNSGKSTLLANLTNAKPKIAEYPFTTKKPEVGILDYHGVKIQVIEIPAIVKNFSETINGGLYLALIRNSDLIILTFNNPEEKKLLDNELYDIKKPILIYDNFDGFADRIWSKLNLIKVFTKTPGKKPDYPPVALEKNANVEDLALIVHKDFLKRFGFARVWGKSVKFSGQTVSLNHKLEDDDIVELHMK